MGKFIGGCALTFAGVYLITSGRAKESDEDDEDDISEEGIRLVDEEAQEYTTEPVEDPQATQRKAIDDEETEIDQFDDSSMPSKQQSYASGSIPRTPQRMGSSRSAASEPFTPRSIDSPLMENPWLSSQDRLGSLNGTQSQNQLAPSTAQFRREMSSSSSKLSPSRPGTPQIRTESTPNLPGSKDERRSSLAKRSMSHMFPGPLISPLSSSLRGIVQDDLMRGIDTPSKSERRKSKGLSRLRSVQRREQPAAESDTLLPALDGEDNQGSVKKKRSHSLSDTLGTLFRKASSKSKRSLTRDEETGNAPVHNQEQEQQGEPSQR